HTMFAKRIASVTKKPNRIEHVEHDERLKNIELKMSSGSADRDRHIVADHLRADHGQRFALGGIYFSGHYRTAGLIGGQNQLADSTARPATKQAKIIGDLHQTASQRFQGAGELNQGI